MTIVLIALLIVCWALLGVKDNDTHAAPHLRRYQRKMLHSHD